MGEAMESVTVRQNALPLHIVQNLPNFSRRTFAVIQEGNKIRDGALKIDIVLPESVVGVDEEVLSNAIAKSHTLMISLCPWLQKLETKPAKNLCCYNRKQ